MFQEMGLNYLALEYGHQNETCHRLDAVQLTVLVRIITPPPDVELYSSMKNGPFLRVIGGENEMRLVYSATPST